MDCVTVLLATFNQEKYIKFSINSVLMQDYENIQLIIADDSSDYFKVEEIKRYVDEHNRGNIKDLVVIRNEQNLGTVKNLNNARRHVSGKYMVLLAGDDLFYDEHVLTNYVNSFSSSIDMVVSQVLHYDENMEEAMFRFLNDEQIALLREGNNRKLYGKMCTQCLIPAIGTACSVELLNKMGDYDERYYLVEDWPFYLRMLRQDVKIVYSDFVSAKHRDGGVSHNVKSRAEERKDRYHQDLINIIRNEILPNYKYADESMQREVYNYANDRIVISEFRTTFKKMSLKEKFFWIIRNKNLPAIFIRGCIRRMKFSKNNANK